MASFVVVACGSAREHRTPETAPVVAPVAPTRATEPSVEPRAVVPRCQAPEAAVPAVTDYGALRAGDAALHRVDVRADPATHEWLPAAQLDMPMHHASRLSWTNLADFQPLRAAEGELLRFTFRVLSRDIRHRPDENVFLVEYRARIELVCSVSAPSTRAEGALVADIELDTTECPALTARVVEAASALAICTRDAECTIIDFGACDIAGLGCYFLPANRDRSVSDLQTALHGLQTHPCPLAECDCEGPPRAARCERGACVPR